MSIAVIISENQVELNGQKFIRIHDTNGCANCQLSGSEYCQPVFDVMRCGGSQAFKELSPVYGPYHDAYMLKLKRDRMNKSPYTSRYGWHEDLKGRIGMLQRLLANTRDWPASRTLPDLIVYALEKFGPPKDWYELAAEYPQQTGNEISYARESALKKYQTDYVLNYITTKPGRYLARHWPDVSDHEIRNAVELHCGDKYTMLDKMPEILQHLADGPSSCMAWSTDGDSWFDDDDDGQEYPLSTHPYEVYCPSLGWRLAVVKTGAKVTGRALVNVDAKCFVRTYGMSGTGDHTGSHSGLEQWLKDQGFRYIRAWPEGVKVLAIKWGYGDEKTGYVAPYCDPGSGRIESEHHRRFRLQGDYFVRDNTGEYVFDNTDGTPDYQELDYTSCEDCDFTSTDNDDFRHVGEHGDRCVCDSCFQNYTYVIGRRSHAYYVPEDEAVEVDGENYHTEYLSEHDIVEDSEGDYYRMGDVTYCEDTSEYYREDNIGSYDDENTRCDVVRLADDEVVAKYNVEWCVYNEEWKLTGDCTELADSRFVFTDDFNTYVEELSSLEEVEDEVRPEDLEDAKRIWLEANEDNPTIDMFAVAPTVMESTHATT